MTGVGNINSNSNTQNINTIETKSQVNQPSKEYSYGFRAILKSIGRYLTCGFSSTKRRAIVIKEFANTSIPDISKLKNRSAEVKTALLTSNNLSDQQKSTIYNEYKTEIDTYIQKHKLEHPIGKKINEKLISNNLSNQEKLEFYAQNMTEIDSYCQTSGIKNPLLGNSSFNDLEKITAQGIYTVNFPTASNIEIFMNGLEAYVNKEFSAIEKVDNLDEKKSKIEKLYTSIQEMIMILNKTNLKLDPISLEQPLKKQQELFLGNFFQQAIANQKLTRMVMPMKGWLDLVNKSNAKPGEIKGAWNEIKKQIDFSDQKLILNKTNTLKNFKTTLDSFNKNYNLNDEMGGIKAMQRFNGPEFKD
ncbi:MAG: hypothetical protein ACLRFH_03605 [Opitutales bacterium]